MRLRFWRKSTPDPLVERHAHEVIDNIIVFGEGGGQFYLRVLTRSHNRKHIAAVVKRAEELIPERATRYAVEVLALRAEVV